MKKIVNIQKNPHLQLLSPGTGEEGKDSASCTLTHSTDSLFAYTQIIRSYRAYYLGKSVVVSAVLIPMLGDVPR
jgi:hypothetical protein